MSNLYENLIINRGQNFQIQRDGQNVGEVKGVLNNETETNRKYIGVLPDTQIQKGDRFVSPNGTYLLIIDVTTHYFDGDAVQVKGYYEEEQQNNENIQEIAPLKACEDIQTLKNHTQYLTGEDAADIHQVVDLIDMLLRTHLIARAALLTDYTGVLNRHPWLAESVQNIIYQWLIQPTK